MSLSPRELMIGSIVCYEGKARIISGLREFVMFQGIKEWIGCGFMNGEPISEVWLEKFGFECDGVTWSKKHILLAPGGEWFDLWAHGISCPILAQITYVHQLQMIYFSLTGEHLPIPKLPK